MKFYSMRIYFSVLWDAGQTSAMTEREAMRNGEEPFGEREVTIAARRSTLSRGKALLTFGKLRLLRDTSTLSGGKVLWPLERV
jgi:hypothetical protein